MEDRNFEDQSVTFLAMELNQSSTYYALVSSYMNMQYAMGDTAPQTVQLHPFSRLEFQARSF